MINIQDKTQKNYRIYAIVFNTKLYILNIFLI